ncbi:hypothetical protein SADUNF_Sadunf14G0098200 [Salix dunnii]|uniref:Uncharacterized protein n=1 Tax=Salix dunnii TaxID=1413687 RepID=A0A835JDT2_9ROSI|nr:hypothetical protein SADUNF_Sadunf14G0098200 [Salix dunnii]
MKQHSCCFNFLMAGVGGSGEGKKAMDRPCTALREYNLKFGTILKYLTWPHLELCLSSGNSKEGFPLRFLYMLDGGDIGNGLHRDLKLISEVQAPFRGVTRFFYKAFSAAAGISLLFTNPRLFRAIRGCGDAPELWETVGNAAINTGGTFLGSKMTKVLNQQSTCIIVLVALFFWDSKRGEGQLAEITEDETLSSLPLHLSTNRFVELVQLRDTVRPVFNKSFLFFTRQITYIVPHNYKLNHNKEKETVSLAMQKADRAPEVEKKRFGVPQNAAASLPSKGVVSPAEWESFHPASKKRQIRDQQKSEGVTPGEDAYVILHLDGRGMPDRPQIVKELPPMEAFLSKLKDRSQGFWHFKEF